VTLRAAEPDVSVKKCHLPDEFMNSGQLGRYLLLFLTSIIATITKKANIDSKDRGNADAHREAINPATFDAPDAGW
jgi:hypothetical protein